jgi:monoamine oxidase
MIGITKIQGQKENHHRSQTPSLHLNQNQIKDGKVKTNITMIEAFHHRLETEIKKEEADLRIIKRKTHRRVKVK